MSNSRTAHTKSGISLGNYEVLVCKGGVYNTVNEDNLNNSEDDRAYTSPKDARTVFSCDGGVGAHRGNFSKMQDGTYMCGQKPGPAGPGPAGPAMTLTAGKISKKYIAIA